MPLTALNAAPRKGTPLLLTHTEVMESARAIHARLTTVYGLTISAPRSARGLHAGTARAFTAQGAELTDAQRAAVTLCAAHLRTVATAIHRNRTGDERRAVHALAAALAALEPKPEEEDEHQEHAATAATA